MAVKPTTAAKTATTKKATDAAGRRKATKGEPAFASYADKAVTPVIAEFAAWITEQTGVEVDAQSVFLGSALRGAFQKSEGNQARIAARKAELEAEEAAKIARAAERAAAKEAKATAVKEAKAAPKAAPAKAAAKSTAKAPAAKTAAKPVAKAAAGKAAPKATTTSRRPAAAKPVVATEEI